MNVYKTGRTFAGMNSWCKVTSGVRKWNIRCGSFIDHAARALLPPKAAIVRDSAETTTLTALAGRTKASVPTHAIKHLASTYLSQGPMTFVTLPSRYRTPRIAFV